MTIALLWRAKVTYHSKFSSRLSSHTGQCLDLTNGNLTNGNRVQTWSCTANNANQVWTLRGTRPPTPPSPPVLRIHPNGNSAKCLDVRADVVANGTPVQMYVCQSDVIVLVIRMTVCLRAAVTTVMEPPRKAGTSNEAVPRSAWTVPTSV